MFAHIAVADDGSEQSRAGFAFAAALAARVGARVTVASAVDWPEDLLASISEPMPGLDRLLERRQRECADALTALAETAPEGTRVDTRVLHGKPAPAVLDLLDELRPDLVVAGTHGVGFTRFVLGSVSQRLLESAPCDLLLFRGPEVPEGHVQVIAAVDGSEPARRGVAVAEDLAAGLRARLVLTHVVDDALPFAENPDESAHLAAREHGARLLREARETIAAPADVVEDLREGHPREELIAACGERAPAVAVIGSRGVGGFHGLLVGSMARDLVNHAECPVLITRPAEATG